MIIYYTLSHIFVREGGGGGNVTCNFRMLKSLHSQYWLIALPHPKTEDTSIMSYGVHTYPVNICILVVGCVHVYVALLEMPYK